MALTTNLNKYQRQGFRVVIDRENYGSAEYMAYSVNHPGLTLPSSPVSYRGAKSFVPGDTIDFESLSIEFQLDEGFKSYKELLDWICRNRDDNYVSHYKRQTSDYIPSQADITIPLLGSDNNQFGKIVYKDATPNNISPLEFTAQDESVEYSTFIITFDITSFTLTLTE